jgi:hypothetical protein
MRKCGNCGKTGHNRRTCPGLKKKKTKKPTVKVEKIEEVKIVKKKRPVMKSDPPIPEPTGRVIGPVMMDCGHWSWWKEQGECQLCNKPMFRKKRSMNASQ